VYGSSRVIFRSLMQATTYILAAGMSSSASKTLKADTEITMAEQLAEKPKAEDRPKADRPAEEKAPARPKRRMGPLGWLILLVILVAAVFGGMRLLAYLDSYEETDDAQVDGDIYAVTSRIAGTIKAVHVQDNQQVKAGQLLVELDPADYDVALQQARAAVQESRSQVAAIRPNVSITTLSTETAVSSFQAETAGARAQVAAAQRDYESTIAQVRQAEADLAKAQADLARYKQLIAKDEISQQQYDQAEANARSLSALTDARRASAEAAARNIEAAQARLQQSEVRESEASRNRPQMIQLQNAQVQSRQASTAVQQSLLNQATLNLSYVNIVAPVDGIIGRKNAEAGQHVTAGQQLKRMAPNQRVTFHVDAYDRDYEGSVESVAGASGARFSLLPPENATGNYVKVVQRVPVRIRIKEGQDPEHRLRPGMSVVPKVWLQ
jgi:membrane fusion protein (multidrug efflux system)